MSQLPLNSDFDTPSRLFGGVARQSSNRRLHQVARPYSRPASYTGPSTSTQNGNANVASGPATQGRMESTQPPSMFTRPLPNSISTNTVSSGMTRSSSDPSLSARESGGGLLSGFKSMFSRPLQWLATPSRGTRREQDVEDLESPVVQRRPNGNAEPPREGRAGQMPPPLPPNVTLSPRNRPPPTTNLSRPLHTARSLPHLDPPGTVFNSPSTSGRTSGVLTRSRRVNVEETEEESEDKETWSPWKDQQRRASPRLTPARGTTPLRRGSVQDRPLPSQSPFRPTRSPSQRANGSGLYRSNTTANTTTFARAGSVMSDVSMGRESIKSPRKAGSVLFSHKEDGMSVDGDRPEGSTGFFSKARWENGSTRFGSPARGPAIRRGQLVWDSEKGFVRESELQQDRGSNPVGKNEAEKILFALEAKRETLSSGSMSLPPELIGASSRTLRQAISVPLATAMAGDTARGRRDQERAANKTSLMISPYGRRRQVDEDARHERRATRERDEEYRPSSERQPTPSDHSSHGDTDYSMHSETEAEAPPPRRSRRNKRREATPDETTPKARKTGKGKAAGESARAKQDSPTKSRRSKRHAETPSSPAPPEVDKTVPPVPSVPTITETAPSPDAKSTSTYAPRAEGETPREGSSLRAKSSVSKRTHGPSVSLSNSRATSPTSSGRFSAKEEDLPPMDELEAPKIPFNSFSGVSFALEKPPPKADPPAPPAGSLASRIGPKPETLGVPRISSGPLSRINSSRPRASSPLASSSIVAAPESPPSEPPAPAEPPSGGIFPLATGSTTPTKPPPASLFAGISGEPKKSLGSGLGKPPAESSVPDFFGKKSQPGSGTVTPSSQPFNFGAAEPPKPLPAFGEAKTNGSTPFSFGAPSTNGPTSDEKAEAPAPSKSPASFGTAEASKPAFSFGQPSTPAEQPAEKPAEPPKPFSGFTFGQTATQAPAEKVNGSANGTAGFSFSKTNEQRPEPTKAEPPKASFSFGTTSAEPVKPAFSFGAAPAESKPKEESAKPAGFSFGAPAAGPPAAPASGSLSFGKPAETAPPSTFGFGSQANGTGGTDKGAFGGSSGSTNSTSFGGFGSTSQANGIANNGTTNTFGNTPGSSGFSFGSSAAPTNSFGAAPTPPSNSFGSVPATPSNPFNSAPASAPASSGSGFNFSFSAPSPVNGAAPSPSFSFGQQPSPSTPSNPNPAPFQFGSGTPQSSGSTPAFTFGASGGTPQSQGSQSFVFGGGMNGQPPQPPRFGSPGPGQDSPSGGFSMGMEPASPSGRKIKPLRRGAVKR